MNIAYILSPSNCMPLNGIRIQAEAWQKSLEEIGHKVEFPSMINLANFGKYDVIHFFGNGLALIPFIQTISKHNPNVVVSPIIDSYKPTWLYRIMANTSFPSLRLYSINGALKDMQDLIKKVFVRSQHEYNYIHKSYRFPENKIAKVMLAHRMQNNIDPKEFTEKENYCLHVSAIYQERKNVIRLIEAAKKFKFNLVLAGNCGNEKQFEPIKKAIGNSEFIKVLGKISDEELVELYKRAKVFALPSIEEGVGQVALEAACYGCNIVITNIGGPKEYFEDKAHVVNPFDIDDIGSNIKEALRYPANAELAHYVSENYNSSNIAHQLINEYSNIISQK